MKKKGLYPCIALLVLIASCSSERTPEAKLAGGENATQIEANISPVNPSKTDASEADPSESESESTRILFLGDSITAGYGLGQEEAFPALVQTILSDSGYTTSVVNAGVSGDTSTGGVNRLDWLLQNKVDILVLELGGNDGLRGIDLSLTRSNLARIIEITRETWPEVKILVAGMIVPSNLGHEYTEEFAGIFPSIAEEFGTYLIPFIGERVINHPEMVQPDGIHPRASGHREISITVFKALEPILEQLQIN